MSKLVLDSLEIKNFRAFKHLRIEKLGRVNLIVGKNNVGKTSVLEALWLYVRQGKLEVVWEILAGRDERMQLLGQDQLTIDDDVEALKYLFHGRLDVRDERSIITIGQVDSEDDNLFLELVWYAAAAGGLGILGPLANLEGSNTPELKMLEPSEVRTAKQAIPFLLVGAGSRATEAYSLALRTERHASALNGAGFVPSVFISSKGITRIQIGKLWDEISLTDLESDVLLAMRLVAPGIERITLRAEKSTYLQRNPIVKFTGSSNPIPLRSLGEGVYRMFGIALALVNAKDGMLLIDEVDTGLHYSVLPDLWKLIFEVAHRLNVQVFATSHSWDCIQAFQQAADENTEEEGMLVRLEHRDGEVVPVLFDERKLNIAAREQIEVR